MRTLIRSRSARALAAIAACAVAVSVGWLLGAVTVAGEAGTPIQFATIAPQSLQRVGLVFVTPTEAQEQRVAVSREAAVEAAEEQSAGFTTREAHLADWHENAGSVTEEDHLVWLVVQESPSGYYVNKGPAGTPANTAYIAFVDPMSGAWLGAESFGR